MEKYKEYSMPINPMMIKKGVEIAGKVVQTADTINTVSEQMGINQDSIFAEKQKNGKGGALNSVFQAADTVTNGKVSTVVGTLDKVTNGAASGAVETADKIVTPVMNVVNGVGGENQEEILKKLAAKGAGGMNTQV